MLKLQVEETIAMQDIMVEEIDELDKQDEEQMIAEMEQDQAEDDEVESLKL